MLFPFFFFSPFSCGPSSRRSAERRVVANRSRDALLRRAFPASPRPHSFFLLFPSLSFPPPPPFPRMSELSIKGNARFMVIASLNAERRTGAHVSLPLPFFFPFPFYGTGAHSARLATALRTAVSHRSSRRCCRSQPFSSLLTGLRASSRYAPSSFFFLFSARAPKIRIKWPGSNLPQNPPPPPQKAFSSIFSFFPPPFPPPLFLVLGGAECAKPLQREPGRRVFFLFLFFFFPPPYLLSPGQARSPPLYHSVETIPFFLFFSCNPPPTKRGTSRDRGRPVSSQALLPSEKLFRSMVSGILLLSFPLPFFSPPSASTEHEELSRRLCPCDRFTGRGNDLFSQHFCPLPLFPTFPPPLYWAEETCSRWRKVMRENLTARFCSSPSRKRTPMHLISSLFFFFSPPLMTARCS